MGINGLFYIATRSSVGRLRCLGTFGQAENLAQNHFIKGKRFFRARNGFVLRRFIQTQTV